MAKKSQFSDGYLSKPGSPSSLEWLESVRATTPWLADIVLEDWRARGVELPAVRFADKPIQQLSKIWTTQKPSTLRIRSVSRLSVGC
jgi:hypothetical protein